MTETASSIAPNGEIFPLPQPEDYAQELERLKALVAEHRAQGQEIVVVMGVGFVGAVMAGIIADSVKKVPNPLPITHNPLPVFITHDPYFHCSPLIAIFS